MHHILLNYLFIHLFSHLEIFGLLTNIGFLGDYADTVLSMSQAEELKKSLIEKDIPAKVYVGMRYWHPFTEEAIELVSRIVGS